MRGQSRLCHHWRGSFGCTTCRRCWFGFWEPIWAISFLTFRTVCWRRGCPWPRGVLRVHGFGCFWIRPPSRYRPFLPPLSWAGRTFHWRGQSVCDWSIWSTWVPIPVARPFQACPAHSCWYFISTWLPIALFSFLIFRVQRLVFLFGGTCLWGRFLLFRHSIDTHRWSFTPWCFGFKWGLQPLSTFHSKVHFVCSEGWYCFLSWLRMSFTICSRTSRTGCQLPFSSYSTAISSRVLRFFVGIPFYILQGHIHSGWELFRGPWFCFLKISFLFWPYRPNCLSIRNFPWWTGVNSLPSSFWSWFLDSKFSSFECFWVGCCIFPPARIFTPPSSSFLLRTIRYDRG